MVESIVIYDTVPEPTEIKSPYEIALERRAIMSYQTWRLVTSGAASLAELGFGDPVPEPVLLEFLVVDSEVNTARARRQRLDANKRHGID